VTPKPGVRWFPAGRPGAVPSTFPVLLVCDVDCAFRLRIERLPSHGTTLQVRGNAVGRVPQRVEFRQTRLAPGRYRFTLWAVATQNVGPPFTGVGPTFTVPRR
jgi:hypothetical protein